MSAAKYRVQFSLVHRRIIGALLCVLLAACAPRETAQFAAPSPEATPYPIYVATQRKLDRTGPYFGEKRPEGVRFFRNVISVPPTHTPGHIEWPEGPADTAVDFAVTETEVFSGMSEMRSHIRARRSGKETLVFVHGYNNTLSDAMYRLAQIQSDFKTGMPGVLFSWQSAGDARGYIYDRDSVLHARDDLEEVLNGLTAAPGEKVFLLAHSMGSQLTMEVLRQAALRGNRRLLDRISGVVLMSPDIDPDVFRHQAKTIGKLPDPFMIFVSRQDRALSLAGFITGRKPRLGVIDGPEQVADLGVTVVDFTALSDGEGLNHMVPVASPAAVSVLQGMLAQAQSGGTPFNDYLILDAPILKTGNP
ncbi:alpha/beta fold hydrolase [Pseudohalocynthiibacter aestuariivivens]|uniref:Alpha/beta fold hydrolase n=1 Tax=Roseovarius pelagicus TaxID=2980108 RepID=A0ABY6DDJ1_9RHOB|nr:MULTISPECIES: alpha/beta fold hydrolase [Rhodobacterales]QIE47270.1 alpha/beta fold hydrolase [Pseudohalocynthiibacter aestuariivivens]UXX84173.1 alpha/beta fold hydrolase [Roseovarius pelagicus]